MVTKLLLFLSVICLAGFNASAQNALPEIERFRGQHRANKELLNRYQVEYLLEHGDPYAFNQYMRGRKTIRTGGIMAIVGGAVTGVGGVISVAEAIGSISPNYNDPKMVGPGIVIGGGALAIIGFATMISGKVQKSNAIKHYNKTIRQQNSKAYFYHRLSPTYAAVGICF